MGVAKMATNRYGRSCGVGRATESLTGVVASTGAAYLREEVRRYNLR